MNNFKNTLIVIGIIIILLLGTFIGGYQYAKKVYTTNHATYTNVVTVRDTIEHDTTIVKLVPYKVVEKDTVYKNVDSAAIIKDYFREKYYHIPTQFVDLNFKITQNDIFDLKIKTYTVATTTYIKPLYMLGVGGSLGFVYNKPFVSFDAMYVRNFNTFSLSITYPIGFIIGYKYMFIKYK